MGKPKRPEQGKERTVYAGRIFRVKTVQVTYPSGRVSTHEYCERQPGVVILAFDGRGRILLTREYRIGIDRTVLYVPMGYADKEGTPAAAARRELREETGYDAKRIRHFSDVTHSGAFRGNTSVYIATSLVRAPLPHDEGEEIEVVPTAFREAVRAAAEGEIESDVASLAILRVYHRSRKLGLKRWLAAL